ncbi:methyltransferase [Streptomyces rubellomurinus]|uniref:Methyltransferase n=2 Tax=Streptomyces TaxID=1883 RepID=A0A0F2TLP4_STRR3|nr:methyltransferase [Streptomyces rubellomurinus]KJS57004.1 methyltransferase [Streptomyces rubellomurinus subsp. indigoferus]KJS62652.1 methyltransferase [Streptomyces rubellomurinus]
MTTAPANPQAAMRLRELVFGAACAAAVRAAARLGVADALDDTPATVDELAAALDTEPRALRRLLRALTCYGIFAETAGDRFEHTEMSRLLREDAPNSLRYISLWCTEPWTWEAWPMLDEAVRSGRNVFPELFGKEFFDYLHSEGGDSARVFDKAMTTSSRQSARDFADYLDLTGIDTVVDIGGGQGHVLASLLEKHPALHGTLLDLPKVVAGADPRLRDGGALADRARLVPGDCRVDIPVRADLYIIKNILEWDDDSTRRTLANVVAAARPGARVVVVENLVDDSPSMRFTTAMDLMLMLNVGGAKHSEASMVRLMTEAGLTVTEVRPVNPYLHAFEATVR